MKTLKIFCSLAILFCFLISCNKKPGTPEPYDSYISMQVTKIATLGSDSGKVFQVYLRNDSYKELEKECIMTYSLQDPNAGKYYTSEQIFFNKRIPTIPNGVFNLTYKGTYTFNINLNDLKWNNLDYSSIEPNQYLFDVQLFIKDPYSPLNIIHSNRLNILKL